MSIAARTPGFIGELEFQLHRNWEEQSPKLYNIFKLHQQNENSVPTYISWRVSSKQMAHKEHWYFHYLQWDDLQRYSCGASAHLQEHFGSNSSKIVIHPHVQMAESGRGPLVGPLLHPTLLKVELMAEVYAGQPSRAKWQQSVWLLGKLSLCIALQDYSKFRPMEVSSTKLIKQSNFSWLVDYYPLLEAQPSGNKLQLQNYLIYLGGLRCWALLYLTKNSDLSNRTNSLTYWEVAQFSVWHFYIFMNDIWNTCRGLIVGERTPALHNREQRSEAVWWKPVCPDPFRMIHRGNLY